MDDVSRFLAARMAAQQALASPRCWGISSDAMTLYALGAGRRPQVPGNPTSVNTDGTGYAWHGDQCGENYPHDRGDLAACERTFQMAPIELQLSMLPVLEEFRAWIWDGLDRHGNRTGRVHERPAGDDRHPTSR